MPIPRRETPKQFFARLSGIPLEQINQALMSLPTKLRQVLAHRFGLYSGHFLTFDEVAGALRISRAWAQRLVNRAMRLVQEHHATSLARAS
jgi:DNA-directed RNA polymerase sigma subunit (sigma70/sigma32)